jgi:hypothetical protein
MRHASLCCLLRSCCLISSSAPADSISREQFDSLHSLIRPQEGESPWARVNWSIDLDEARKRSAREDKPLFVWRAGGGEVLGRA